MLVVLANVVTMVEGRLSAPTQNPAGILSYLNCLRGTSSSVEWQVVESSLSGCLDHTAATQ